MHALTRLLCVAVVGLSGTAVFAQGPLQPSAGPEEMMKSLDQIEPRTPINELPFTITESGSYFITGDLTVSGDGIVVEADHVSIDLMGYSLTGDGSSGQGISVTDADGVTIRNGAILAFEDGIRLLNSRFGRLEDLVLSDHFNNGLSVEGTGGGASSGHRIRDISANRNGGVGVALIASSAGSVDGNILTHVRLVDNQINGLSLLAQNGTASGNIIRKGVVKGTALFSGLDVLSQSGGTAAGNIIEDMQVLANDHSGIRLMAFDSDSITSGNIVRNNRIIDNGNQIPALSVQGMNGGQANGNLLENNWVRDNASFGIYLNTSGTGTARGNVIRASTVSGNSTVGIRLDGDTEGTRVEDNTVSDHPTGIQVDSTKAFVFKNVLFNNGTALVAGAGNIVGALNSGTGEIGNTVNAWSNFAP